MISLRRRDAVNNVMQYLAGCAVVTFVLRITACSYLQNHGQDVTTQNRPEIVNRSLELQAKDSVPAVQPAVQPTCKINMNLDLVFPEKSKLWIQIGTWLDPITPPDDVGMIAFEPELSTVTEVAPKRRDNIYFIPAAVSDNSGIAIFGGGMNGGQSSSLNVSLNVTPLKNSRL